MQRPIEQTDPFTGVRCATDWWSAPASQAVGQVGSGGRRKRTDNRPLSGTRLDRPLDAGVSGLASGPGSDGECGSSRL